MKDDKRECIESLAVIIFNFFVVICCLFLIYTCVVEPLMPNPQDRESLIVVTFAGLLVSLIQQLKQYRKNK